MNHCRREGRGRFIGCPQLLTIWFKGHFPCMEPNFDKPYLEGRRPVREYYLNKWPTKEAKGRWVTRLRVLKAEDVVWLAPWFNPTNPINRCGEHHSVPLLGLWGAISYSPLLVRKQFGVQQNISPTHGLGDLEVTFGSVGSGVRVKESLKDLNRLLTIRKFQQDTSSTPEYMEWHKMRVKDIRVPLPSDPTAPVTEVAEDHVMKLTMELERVRGGAVMKELENENQRLARANAEVEAEKQRLARKVENLENQVAREAKKKQKIEDDCQKLKANLIKEGKRAVALGKKAWLCKQVNQFWKEKLEAEKAKKLTADMDETVQTLVKRLH